MGSDCLELQGTESGSSFTLAQCSESESLSFGFFTLWTAAESLGARGSRGVPEYTMKGIITTESYPVTGLTVAPETQSNNLSSPSHEASEWGWGAPCPPQELIISLERIRHIFFQYGYVR